MNISAPFIRRPVMTGLLMISMLVFGVLSFGWLPVSDLPALDFPTIQVSASLPGANADTMATSVATPLERQLSTVPGIKEMSSNSTSGSTNITLQFALDRDIDAAAQDVQSAISTAQRQLPSEMTTPPSLRKVNPADSPVLTLAATSTTLPISAVDEFVQTTLAQRLSMVSGVSQVQIFGSAKYAVRVQLDPGALAAHEIGIDEVAKALDAQNVQRPTGMLRGSQRLYAVQADGQLRNAAEFAGMVVVWRNGAPVRLGELGQVLDSIENDQSSAAFNGQRAVTLTIQRQPGANTVELVDTIQQMLPKLTESMPAGMQLHVVYDRSVAIRAAVHEVMFTLALSLLLVVLVIFAFLRNVRAMLIPALVLPLSLIGTLAVLYVGHYSLDTLSLLALTLCVGFVVDDAIVMMENISRYLEQGRTPMQAAFQGSREIGFTIVSMTLSLVAVFLPVMFMSGVLGRLLHEFAVTIVAAILMSGVVSLTLTPLLCARLLRPHDATASVPRWQQLGDRAFANLQQRYVRSLDWALTHQRTVLMIFVASLAVSAGLFVVTPKGFLPPDDTGQLLGTTEALQNISFADMHRKQSQLARIAMESPWVEAVMASEGTPGLLSNQGRLVIRLKPAGQRPAASEVARQLSSQMQVVPGIRAFLQSPPVIRLEARISKSQYQYTLQDADTQELFAWAPKILSALLAAPSLANVTSDLQISFPTMRLRIDRDRAAALGVTAAQIQDALYAAYGAGKVSTIYTSTNQYSVLLELLPEARATPDALNALYVRSSNQELVPLNAVTSADQSVLPLSITHQGQVSAVTISFDLAPGASLSTAVAEIKRTLAGLAPPARLTGNFMGSAQVFNESLAGMGFLLVMAVFVIYVVLGILYESYRHPLTILSGLPSASLGALLTLLLFGRDLDFYGMVALLLLIGIVKKNAIMMVDFALEAQRNRGDAPLAAIREACAIRFRPILMTSMAALLAAVPVAMRIGSGGAARQPLGLAVVGGLLVSQLLTLYITPVIYLALEKFSKPAPDMSHVSDEGVEV